MKGLALPVALAALVALAGVVLLAALRSPPAPSRAEQSAALAAELRCPDCQALSVADSPSRAAAEIRRQIDQLLAAGRSPDEVRRHFVARYGEWILLAPSAAPVWWLPYAVLALGALGLLAWLGIGRRRTQPASASADAPAAIGEPMHTPLSELERARLRDEAEALDA